MCSLKDSYTSRLQARRRHVLRAVSLMGATAVAPAAWAQAGAPGLSRPVRVIVGFAPGGAVDLIARALAQQMSPSIGQPIVVENRPGAGTNIAMRALIEAAPDGHTLMLAANSLAANPALFQPPPFDAERDVAPVALVGRVPVVIAAGASAPWAHVSALVAAAKARPKALAYGSPGNGSTPHMAVEFFARAAGVELQHVPYKGGSPAITDVIGGQLPLVAVNALEVQPHVRSGRLRVLAVLSPGRSPIFPDVPTIAESGYPGFEASVWYGVIAPAATPAPLLSRWHAEVQRALEANDVRQRLTSAGGEVLPGPIESFAGLIRSERIRYERLVREAQIKPD